MLSNPDPRSPSRELRGRFRDHFDTKLHKRQPILYRRLSRCEVTVPARLRTRSVFTNTLIFDRRLVVTPNCRTCGEEETFLHLLFYCTLHQQARTGSGLDSFNENTAEETLRCTFFLSGTWHRRSERLDALLGYLYITELVKHILL